MVGGPALVLAGVFLASCERPPRLPGDAAHAVEQSETACLSCHGARAANPRPADHPPRDDCFSCHRDSAGVLHPRPGAPTSLPGGWAEGPPLRRGSPKSGAAPAGADPP